MDPRPTLPVPASSADLHAVTGALGYSGKRLTHLLLDRGLRVRTLTNSPARPNPFGPALDIRPLCFDRPDDLAEHLRGVRVLYNTYWVRFNRKNTPGFTHADAVANTRTLFEAAERAGVERIVHVSILNPRQGAGLSYYDGKAALETDLAARAIPSSIVRPGVLFGHGDILVNNIAWALRHLPLFGLFGTGRYALRPMHVDDFAELLASVAPGQTVDAVGPERFEYAALVRAISRAIAVSRPVVPVPARAAWLLGRTLGPALGDVLLTWEEILALTRNLLDSDAPSTGRIALTQWAAGHAADLGARYASEMGRRRDRVSSYAAA